MKNNYLYIIILLFINFSCTTTNSVTSNFGIQKRKYTKGWFFSKKKKISVSHYQSKKEKNNTADLKIDNKTEINESLIDSVYFYSADETITSTDNIEEANTYNEITYIETPEEKEEIDDNLTTKIESNDNTESEKKEHSKFYYFWFYIFLFITNIGYFWALKNPEEAFTKGSKKRKYLIGVQITWVVISIFISIMAGGIPFLSSLFIIWPLFSILFRDKLRKLFGDKKNKKWLWALFTTLFLIISEIGVAIELGRNIGLHLLTFLGFYIGLGIVVLIFYKKDRFNFSQLFLAGGLMGALIEQAFAGPLMLISGNIGGFLIFAWWVFPVYGFYLATTFLMFYEENTTPEGKEKQKKNGFWKTLLIFISTPAIILIVGTIISKILTALGVPLYE